MLTVPWIVTSASKANVKASAIVVTPSSTSTSALTTTVNSFVSDSSPEVIVAVNLTVASSSPLVTLAVLPSITIAVPSVTAHVITDPLLPACGKAKSAVAFSSNFNASLSFATFSASVNGVTSPPAYVTLIENTKILGVEVISITFPPFNSKVKVSGVPASLYGANTSADPFTITLFEFVGWSVVFLYQSWQEISTFTTSTLAANVSFNTPFTVPVPIFKKPDWLG